jgi:hypothetical protein
MDDDMIEASHKSIAVGTDETDEEESEPFEIPLASDYDPDKKFDWSSDALVSGPPAGAHGLDSELSFADLEAADRSAEPSTTPPASDFGISGAETLEMDRESFASLDSNEDSGIDDEAEILDLDLDLELSPSYAANPIDSSDPYQATDPEPRLAEPEAYTELDEDPDAAIHETIPYDIGEQPPIREPEERVEPDNFPPGLIDEISQRVIEKLSDAVVREIARIEVPRIAEKLIREALDGTKRN